VYDKLKKLIDKIILLPFYLEDNDDINLNIHSENYIKIKLKLLFKSAKI